MTVHNSDGTRPVSEAKARTDARGIARFKLDRKGAWLVRLVHLLACPDPADCDDADWQSYWASYTFELD